MPPKSIQELKELLVNDTKVKVAGESVQIRYNVISDNPPGIDGSFGTMSCK